MAEQNSPGTFLYADEEVFIGKKRTQREIIKSTLMGQNYESPVAKPSAGSTSNLPDVINTLSDKNSTEHKASASSSFSPDCHKDDDVIIIDLDSRNDSVQTISDDEEENIVKICGIVKQNTIDWEPKSMSANSNKESDAVAKEIADKEIDVTSECVKEENVTQQETCKLENWKTLVNVVSELKASSRETEDLGSASALSIDALIEASRTLDAPPIEQPVVKDNSLDTVGKPLPNNNTFNNEFSFLTGVNESVLDISHGSSLSSPLVERNDSSLGLLATAVYEDISCDGDQMFDTSGKLPKTKVDLHMSIDETDHMTQGPYQSINAGSDVAQPTFYKSCLSEFSNSVYTTADNTEDLSLSNKPSSSFSNYRDTFDDSVIAEEINNLNCSNIGDDSKNETSFEIVMNNRQNSFATTKVENTPEKTKPFHSKLPVYNCSSNILKPSSLQSNLDNDKLKAKNYKWAKTLPKPSQIKPQNITAQIKTSKIKTATEKSSEQQTQEKKTPSKTLSTQTAKLIKTPVNCFSVHPKSNNTKTPSNTLAAEFIPKNISSKKTPNNRTLLPSKLPKSDVKTPKEARTPTNNLLSSGKRNDNKNLLIDKERYKNVISPVRAYIKSAPIAIQRKVHVPDEQILLMGGSAKKAESHIPKLVNSPLPGSSKTISTSIPVKSSRTVQKLIYNKGQDQENMDPNYRRDTLPKEPEPPKRHLPKIGESMQKLIDTPRPKLIVHQGRVKESPKAKGVLIPTVNIIPSTPESSGQQAAADSRISIRVAKSADHSDN